jgi:hypothetical protein
MRSQSYELITGIRMAYLTVSMYSSRSGENASINRLLASSLSCDEIVSEMTAITRSLLFTYRFAQVST